MRRLFVLIAFYVCFSFQLVANPVFTWDVAQDAHPSALHCYVEGTLNDGAVWYAREVREEDTLFYQQLFADADIMKFFGLGKAVSYEKSEHYLKNIWMPSFQNGEPIGAMTIFLKETNQFVGFCCVSSDGPGYAGVGYAAHKKFWGKGVATSISKVFFSIWAKEVYEIGHGLRDNISSSIVEKFKCFGGAPLNAFVATARPSNIASCKLMLKSGFKSLPLPQENIDIDLSDEAFENSEQIEQYFLSHYFDENADQRLDKDVLYRVIDSEGNERTLSFVSKYNALRYHFVLDIASKVTE
ncbi:MAG: GNAT family N-acetyltransferase [Alphaproteobacteria bacterium]|nr:GNAT family N-acetyltransferase [Alphaproteobacteria bacterium]